MSIREISIDHLHKTHRNGESLLAVHGKLSQLLDEFTAMEPQTEYIRGARQALLSACLIVSEEQQDLCADDPRSHDDIGTAAPDGQGREARTDAKGGA